MNEILEIVLLSLFVSGTATVIAALIGIPSGIFLSISNFAGKKSVKRVIFTLMSLPPVVLGLIVLLIISNEGPLGGLNLLFTAKAIIIAQTLLILPIITGNIITSTEELSVKLIDTVKTLGGKKKDIIKLIMLETKPFIITAIILGFSRAISEVGAVILVGGNIKGSTRVMTGYITLNTSMGNRNESLIMGGILLVIAFIVNSLLERYRYENN
ncbi:ABC transporter permease [Mycoplasmatota bacterium]|nr:ABC transporter permease [Mycoplasmatota bacterium]